MQPVNSPLFVLDFMEPYPGKRSIPQPRLTPDMYTLKLYSDEHKTNVKDAGLKSDMMIRNTGRVDVHYGDICWILKLSKPKKEREKVEKEKAEEPKVMQMETPTPKPMDEKEEEMKIPAKLE